MGTELLVQLTVSKSCKMPAPSAKRAMVYEQRVNFIDNNKSSVLGTDSIGRHPMEVCVNGMNWFVTPGDLINWRGLTRFK